MRWPASPSDEEHGTFAAYQRHTKAGTQPCEPCRDAQRRYQMMWRFRSGHYHDPTRCKRCGSVFIDHICHLAG